MINKKIGILLLVVFLLSVSFIAVQAKNTTNIIASNSIYRSIKGLFGSHKISYQKNGEMTTINSLMELEKYSNSVISGDGYIVIGGQTELSEGFIKDPNSKTVYYIYPSSQKMKRIMSEKAFRRLANMNDEQAIDWNIVKKISVATFNQLKNYQITDYSGYEFEYGSGNVSTGDIIKASTDNKVYLITEDGKKKWIRSESDFNKLKLKWEDLKVLADDEIQKINDDGTVEVEDTTDETNSTSVESIQIRADGKMIHWDVDGYSSKGYKVVWSKNSAPTYPLRSGDKYNYLSSPNASSGEIYQFDGAGTYYVRVCEYLGGQCGVYSNQIEVEL